MRKKLILTVNEEDYVGLQKVIGPKKIGKFVEELAPHVSNINSIL